MNSQKLSRLIQPGMALYFCLLFAFAAVTFFFGDFYLALGEAAVGLLLLPGIIFLLDALSGALDLGRFLDDNRPPLERRRWGSRPRTVKEHTVNPARGRKR